MKKNIILMIFFSIFIIACNDNAQSPNDTSSFNELPPDNSSIPIAEQLISDARATKVFELSQSYIILDIPLQIYGYNPDGSMFYIFDVETELNGIIRSAYYFEADEYGMLASICNTYDPSCTQADNVCLTYCHLLIDEGQGLVDCICVGQLGDGCSLNLDPVDDFTAQNIVIGNNILSAITQAPCQYRADLKIAVL